MSSPIPSRPKDRAFSPLHREWIARSATALLVLRLAEGSAAYLLAAIAGRSPLPGAWAWQGVSFALWIFYTAANLAFFRAYRQRRFSNATVVWDLVVNFMVLLIFAASTGGLRSPALLLCFAKVASYGLLFGAPLGAASAGLMLAALVIFLGLGSVLERAGEVPPVTVETEVAFLLVFAAALASAVWLFQQIARLEQRDRRRAEEAQRASQRAQAAANVTSALLSVSEAVSRLTNVDEVLAKVVEVAPAVLSVDRCAVLLWKEEEQEYRGAAVYGTGPREREAFLQLRLSADQVPDLEWVKRLGHCAVLGPVASQQISGGLSPQVLVAPLLSGGRFYGVVQFTRQTWRPFTQEELRLADGIASHAAVALERARLVEQSYRLLRAIQSADEAVLILDAKTRVLFANRAFHQLFGYSWPELQAVGVANLVEPPASGWQAVRESLLREQRWRGELNALARDGSRFPISLHLSPIFAPDGSLEGVVAIAADIRAEKELQERFARAERLAAAGQLAAGLAHEVNNALAVILGQVEAVREAPEASAFESSLAHIEREGQKIARLIQDLLGFARPRPPEARPLDLAVLADDTLRLLEPELARAQVRVVREGPPRGLPVRGDLQQLQQVLLNLLKNAIEALTGTPNATITVRCRRAAGTVSVEVEDNGPGIPPALASRIFDPFFTTKPRGTGLGLSVSYAIVQAHGGELSVKSAPGAGTTFTLQLTADPSAQAHVENQPVLLVEDDDTLAATVQRMLERHGVPVRRAATGEEALALANATDFDAVLLDVQLPDFSGVEVFHRLQASHPELARRVAFVTGNLWRGASSEPLPPQPTLAKPCTSAELLAVVAQLRGLRRAA